MSHQAIFTDARFASLMVVTLTYLGDPGQLEEQACLLLLGPMDRVRAFSSI